MVYPRYKIQDYAVNSYMRRSPFNQYQNGIQQVSNYSQNNRYYDRSVDKIYNNIQARNTKKALVKQTSLNKTLQNDTYDQVQQTYYYNNNNYINNQNDTVNSNLINYKLINMNNQGIKNMVKGNVSVSYNNFTRYFPKDNYRLHEYENILGKRNNNDNKQIGGDEDAKQKVSMLNQQVMRDNNGRQKEQVGLYQNVVNGQINYVSNDSLGNSVHHHQTPFNRTS